MATLRRAAVILVLVGMAACKTQSSLTAQATHCASSDLTVVPSTYSKAGSTTVWCATCKERLYQCVSNVSRDRVVCQEATEESRCR